MTPDGIVSMILDSIGYAGQNVLNKTIMEPSFGDGAFLVNIVQRIITEGHGHGLTVEEIGEVISTKVFGIEKDENLYHKALERINALTDTCGIPNVTLTNLICSDTLTVCKDFRGTMDYVVGNPPYVRIHNIPDEYRDIVKEFRFVNGTTDLYIVFYELGILMLNDTGKLGYISPNSFLKNTSQKNFRNYLAESGYLSSVYDFKTSKLFEDADTYTCICILDKDRDRPDRSVEYREYDMYRKTAENRFDNGYFRDRLKDKAWNLGSEEDMKFLEANKELPGKIRDVAVVQNGIATNMDSVYVIHVYSDEALTVPYMGKHTDEKRTVYFRDKKRTVRPIESNVLHRCVKASRYHGVPDNTYIIFPYERKPVPGLFTPDGKEIDCGYRPFTEEKLKISFPLTYEYLSSFRDELMKRDMDRNLPWFVFGRTQGLLNSGYKKIVFKHIIEGTSPVIRPYILEEDVLVYSGIYTTIDTGFVISPKLSQNGDREDDRYVFDAELYERALSGVCDIYASDDFIRYCVMTGKDMSGGYIGISAKNVKQFGISPEAFWSFRNNKE